MEMRAIFITVTLLVLSICSTELRAQTVSTLKDAVRDQYINTMSEQKLNDATNNKSSLGLDKYSHVLTNKEMKAFSAKAETETYVIPLTKQVLYIRIPSFHAKTSFQLHKALVVAKLQSDATHIIVDLRDNRGGLLNAAVQVADKFVSTGTLATTKGRIDRVNLVFLAKPNAVLEGKKVVVLINKNTASAAELLAGILKTDANALILGENSLGKSAVQAMIKLDDGDTLSLTTAVYYFSNGQTVSKHGLTPDVELSRGQLRGFPIMKIDSSANTKMHFNQQISNSVAWDSNQYVATALSMR